MTEKTAELADFNNKSVLASSVDRLQQFDISSALQTTLEFNDLIQIFCNKIQALVPHNSAEYVNPDFGHRYERGVIGRHSCRYTLEIENQSLGTITLTRTQRFRKHELDRLESLLCCLIYPLRNAVRYHQAMQKAYTDPLTCLYNRSAFNDMLAREVQRALRNHEQLSLIFIDIDHFKHINDEHGHAGGDLALTTIANKIGESIRGGDLAFRYGGEEFVVLLSNTDQTNSVMVAERIRSSIESLTLTFGLAKLSITASLGVSTFYTGDNLESFVNRADAIMYRAKQAGRNQVCIN
ncbi:MAG: GGDEF domain-containing protein [Gammaproteobacteria bacterium]